MKIKTIHTVLIIMTCVLMLAVSVYAEAKHPCEPYADALCELGLFKGTGNGYELERTPTRAEALTLLIRLLGKEDEALSKNLPHPFKDGCWADAYIGYAYENGLVNGISETEFGSQLPMTANQYATLLLRALGYSDDTGGQFGYDTALEFALHKLDTEPYDGEFTRGELARLSWAALNTPLYGQFKTLARALMSDRAFTQNELSTATEIAPAKTVKTAVLVYAVASDLESKLGMLSMDLDEMMSAKTDGIDIIVQSGGTGNYRNAALVDGVTQRFRIVNGAITDHKALGDVPMCEAQTLTDFLEFAKESTDAERYVLVFWDHGEGTLGGFGRDELSGDDSLSLGELKPAMDSFGGKIDIAVFDACLMGTVEVAYALSDSTEFIVASEDITPTDGIYYTTWLSGLANDTKMTDAELARLIVDAYVVHAPPEREDVTMTVIRSDRVKPLTEAVSKALVKLSADKNRMKLLSETKVKPYGFDKGNDQYDLIGILSEADMDVSELNVALEGALYYKRSAVSGKYSGLALYLPLTRKEDYPRVKDDLETIGYPEDAICVLDAIYD